MDVYIKGPFFFSWSPCPPCSPHSSLRATTVQVRRWRAEEEADAGQVSPEWPGMDSGRRGEPLTCHKSYGRSKIRIKKAHRCLDKDFFSETNRHRGQCLSNLLFLSAFYFISGCYSRISSCLTQHHRRGTKMEAFFSIALLILWPKLQKFEDPIHPPSTSAHPTATAGEAASGVKNIKVAEFENATWAAL